VSVRSKRPSVENVASGPWSDTPGHVRSYVDLQGLCCELVHGLTDDVAGYERDMIRAVEYSVRVLAADNKGHSSRSRFSAPSKDKQATE
jgi:hypothetical protein